MNNKILPFTLLMVMLIVVNCGGRAQRPRASQPVQIDGTDTSLRRIVDAKAGVVCWFIDPNAFGPIPISCLPLKDTTLAK